MYTPSQENYVDGSFIVCKTFLELHSKTVLQHSPKQLKQMVKRTLNTIQQTVFRTLMHCLAFAPTLDGNLRVFQTKTWIRLDEQNGPFCYFFFRFYMFKTSPHLLSQLFSCFDRCGGEQIMTEFKFLGEQFLKSE